MTDGGQASGNLDGLRLQRVCADEGLPWQVEVHAELPSTSDELKNRARIETVSGVVVFAESQTAGRGRRSNQWISGAGLTIFGRSPA